MVDIGPNIAILTIKLYGQNSLVKSQKLRVCILKVLDVSSCLQKDTKNISVMESWM